MTGKTLESAQVPAAVLEVVGGLQRAGHRAFLVGGCVRDLLRAQPPKDFDVATSARPEHVKQCFARVIPTGIEHGTVTVLMRGEHVEVTTFRAEAEYLDGRRPSKVEFHEDIEADLSRRDFTMNAIAWDPIAGALVDPFDGQGDLSRRTVRCVRNALDRFSEDGLRPLRAVRFATVLDFELEAETEAAIPRTLGVFKRVAQERVHQEFTKLLLSSHVEKGLRLLDRTGLLAMFLDEAQRSAFAAVGRAGADEIERLSVLLHPRTDARAALARLKFPSKVCEEVGAIAAVASLPETGASDADLRRFLAKVGRERSAVLLKAHGAMGAQPVLERLAAQLETRAPLAAKDLALDGQAIMKALQVGPSPLVGQATRFLVEAVLTSPSSNSPEQLMKLLAGWTRPTG